MWINLGSFLYYSFWQHISNLIGFPSTIVRFSEILFFSHIFRIELNERVSHVIINKKLFISVSSLYFLKYFACISCFRYLKGKERKFSDFSSSVNRSKWTRKEFEAVKSINWRKDNARSVWNSSGVLIIDSMLPASSSPVNSPISMTTRVTNNRTAVAQFQTTTLWSNWRLAAEQRASSN